MTLPPMAWQTPTKIPTHSVSYIQLIKPVEQPRFPDRTKEAHEAEVHNQEQARLASIEAARIVKEQQQAELAAQAVYTPQTVSGTLTGSHGWVSPLNNCVLLAEQYGKIQSGNPISWRITTHTPFIGAAALFPFNHVGIVTGIWSNGDVEIAQANYHGNQTRYSPSELRGYF